MKNLNASGRRVPPTKSYPTRIQITPNRPLIPLGEKFGRWEVVENGLYHRGENYFRRACRCRCECGNEAIVMSNQLRRGHSKSCGCLALEYVRKQRERHPTFAIGTKIGRWEVLENDLTRIFPSQTQRACRVRCECGTEVVRTYGELRCGRSPSCGCKSKERSIDAIWNDLFRQVSSRGREFHLTLPEFKIISKLPCAYCGKEPENIGRMKYKINGRYQRVDDPSLQIRYSGIDRIDSTKDYVHGNVVPCCYGCNAMKSKLPLDVFLAFVARIQKHNPSVDGIRHQAATIFLLSS